MDETGRGQAATCQETLMGQPTSPVEAPPNVSLQPAGLKANPGLVSRGVKTAVTVEAPAAADKHVIIRGVANPRNQVRIWCFVLPTAGLPWGLSG